jgi:uncharacterized membrane protein YeaQ/YmgE (transglycosylase-associated protein family)
MMNMALWILIGGAVGWLAHMYLGFDKRGPLGSAIIGALGAVVGGNLVAPMFNAGAAVPEAFTTAGMFFAAALAVAFLLISNFVHSRWGV